MGNADGKPNVITVTHWYVYLVVLTLYIYPGEQANPSKHKPVVKIGVIVDQNDERSGSMNKSVGTAMFVSNFTQSVRMNPIIQETNIRNNYKLRQTICTLIDQQPIALIGTSVSKTFDIIQSYSRALTIPFFLPTLTRESTFDRQNYIISMCPSFINAMIDYIRRLQWDRIFYLFDTDDALWRLQKLYQAFQDNPIFKKKTPFLIDAIRIPDVGNCREVLRKLDRNYNFDQKRIIVDLYSIEDYDTFLSQIIDVGMNRDGYHYLLGTLDIKGMNAELWKSFTYGGVNITGFQLINKNKWGRAHNTMYDKLEIDKDPSVEVALTVDAVAVLTNAFQRIMKTNSSAFPFRRGILFLDMNCSDPISNLDQGPTIIQHIKQTDSKGLSGHIAFDDHLRRKGYELDIFHLSYRSTLRKKWREIETGGNLYRNIVDQNGVPGKWMSPPENLNCMCYRHIGKRNGLKDREIIGSWEDGVGLSPTIPGPPKRSSSKSSNSTQIITTVVNEPFVALKRTDMVNGKPLVGNDRFEGYCIDMIETVAQKVNFTYEIQELKSKKYGSLLEDGTWDGMIGNLLDDKADIALGSLSITRKREEVVRFSKPFMNTGISIMIKKPEKEKPGVFSFMEPLSYDVWALILCGFFAVSFILYMVGRFSPYEWQEENNGSGPSDTFSFVNTLWFSLGALMQQGPDIFPRSLSGRILGSAWWFFTLIIISSYTANLAAFLTFEKLTTQINSVDDLQKQTSIKYGIQRPGATFDFFKESNVTVYKKMYNFMIEQQPSVFVDKPKKGWEKVYTSKGKYAFLLESSSNKYFNQRKPCKTMWVGRNLDEKGYGIATRKDSYLANGINIAVLEMRENGDLLKMEQKWWYSKGECGTAEGGDKGKSALNLSNVSGIFHILIGGLVLSMVISLSQIIFHTKLRPKTKRNNYTVNNVKSGTSNDTRSYRGPRKVTIEETPVTPVITCTTSNGGVSYGATFNNL